MSPLMSSGVVRSLGVPDQFNSGSWQNLISINEKERADFRPALLI